MEIKGEAYRNGSGHNGEGVSCKYSSVHHILEDQAPAHTGIVIPDGLFVHNVKGHLEIATVRD